MQAQTGLRVLHNDVIPGSVDNRYQAAQIVVLEPTAVGRRAPAQQQGIKKAD